jgi:hypothetical protein
VHGDNQIPVLVFHVLEADISQDTSVVEQDVNAAIILNSGLDDLLTMLYAVVVGYRFTASSFDLVDDDVGCLVDRCWLAIVPTSAGHSEKWATYLGRVSLTLERSSQVIDNHTRTSRPEKKCVSPTKPTSCPCYDDYLTIKS